MLALGDVVRHSGFDTVIEALTVVSDAELLVVEPVRSALPHEDPEQARLIRHARKHDVAHRLGFTGGLDRRALPALLRSADVAVCVPWREPSGIGALQAKACGVPVIAFAVGARRPRPNPLLLGRYGGGDRARLPDDGGHRVQRHRLTAMSS